MLLTRFAFPTLFTAPNLSYSIWSTAGRCALCDWFRRFQPKTIPAFLSDCGRIKTSPSLFLSLRCIFSPPRWLHPFWKQGYNFLFWSYCRHASFASKMYSISPFILYLRHSLLQDSLPCSLQKRLVANLTDTTIYYASMHLPKQTHHLDCQLI